MCNRMLRDVVLSFLSEIFSVFFRKYLAPLSIARLSVPELSASDSGHSPQLSLVVVRLDEKTRATAVPHHG